MTISSETDKVPLSCWKTTFSHPCFFATNLNFVLTKSSTKLNHHLRLRADLVTKKQKKKNKTKKTKRPGKERLPAQVVVQCWCVRLGFWLTLPGKHSVPWRARYLGVTRLLYSVTNSLFLSLVQQLQAQSYHFNLANIRRLCIEVAARLVKTKTFLTFFECYFHHTIFIMETFLH